MNSFLPGRALIQKALLFLNRSAAGLLVFLPLLAQASEYTTAIVSQTENSLKVKFTFDKPSLVHEGGHWLASYKKASFINDANGTKIPLITELISFPAKEARSRVISQKIQSMPLDNYFSAQQTVNPPPVEVLKYLGVFRGVSLFALSLTPVKYDPSSAALNWTSEIIIEISATTDLKKKSPQKTFVRKSPLVEKALISGGRLFYQENSTAEMHSAVSTDPGLLSAQNVFKIKVNETGLYKISYDDLQEAGYPFNEVNFQNLALYTKNLEVPIYISGFKDGSFDNGDNIEFWAEKNEKTFLAQHEDIYADPFSDDNVYWLAEKSSPALRYIEENGAVVENNPQNILRPSRFRENLHFEKDTHWERFGHDPENINQPAYTYDHWFWGGVISSVSSKDYDFKLPWPYEAGSGASVFVEAMFRGISIYNYRTNPIQGHKLEVWLDKTDGSQKTGVKVGEVLPQDGWQGQSKRKIFNQNGLPGTSVKNGTNTLRLVMDQEGLTDIVLLNWFNVSYLRKYRADEGYIKFTVQENLVSDPRVKQFEIDGFDNSNIEIYKIGISKIVSSRTDLFEDDFGFESYRVTFQDHIFDPQVQYIALNESAKKKPLSIEKYLPWKEDQPEMVLNNPANTADLIIISPAIFEEQVNRFKSLKEALGYTVQTVSAAQIYDTYNFGIKSPLAIKAFLKDAYFNWDQSHKLKYVILAGDGSYDSKQLLSSTNDIIPVIMFSTNTFGASPSDLQYALLDGDDLIPDVSIGRIPAATIQELANYVDKVESYQNNSENSAWKKKAVFISGNDGSGADLEFLTNKPIFRAQNARIINLKLPDDVMAYKLNTLRDETIPEGRNDPDFGSTRELIDYIDDGVAFVNFFGHGGGAIWADKVLFDLDDADNLRNTAKYPFVASMTCFTGAFENPNRTGLAEKLLLTENKGAIAALASSSVGWKYNDFAVEWALLDYLWDEDFTFGDAVDLMKISYMANAQYYTENGTITTPGYRNQGNSPLWSSMVNQYNLLGDPTLKMVKTQHEMTLQFSSRTPAAGEQIQIIVQAPAAISSGSGEIDITDDQNIRYFSENFTFQDGRYLLNFNVPDSIAGSRLKVKAYISNGQADASAGAELAVERAVIASVKITPDNPEITDPLNFEITAYSYNPIAHMELRYFRNEDGASNTQLLVIMEQVNDTLFRSVSPLFWPLKSGLSYFEIYVRDEANKESIFDLQRLFLSDNRPDLVLDNNSLSYSGNDRLFLSFDVNNNSDSVMDSVYIRCFKGQDAQPFYDDITSFQAGQKQTINAPFVMDTLLQSQTFTIQLDPLNTIAERLENNNALTKNLVTDHIFVNRQTGTSADGVTQGIIPIFENWRLEIPANVLQASTVLALKKESVADFIHSSSQKDLKFIALRSSSDSSALRITANNSVSMLSASLFAAVDSTVYSQAEILNAHFYKFDPFLGLWGKLESDHSGATISTQISQNGLYGVFSSSDEKEPLIEITANGRTLSAGFENNIGISPNISILLQDDNGIDFSNTFSIAIDGTVLPRESLIIPDSVLNPNSIAIVANPVLEKGAHSLEIAAADFNRNMASVSINFQAVNSDEFIVYGNYPNPFSTSTIISYYNDSDDLYELNTRIFSVSGHLVRKKLLPTPGGVNDNILGTDYHELEWDGTDENDNQVANGVYFVIVEAVYKDNSGKKTSVKKKLKVARLK